VSLEKKKRVTNGIRNILEYTYNPNARGIPVVSCPLLPIQYVLIHTCLLHVMPAVTSLTWGRTIKYLQRPTERGCGFIRNVKRYRIRNRDLMCSVMGAKLGLSLH